MDDTAIQAATRLILDDDCRDGPKEDYTVRVFHGTTHDFDVFDPAHRSNRESAFGPMIYFTSSFDNAARHYAGAMEMDGRIAITRAGMGEDVDEDRIAQMRADLIGSSPRVVEAEVRIGRAFHLDGASALFDGGLHVLADGRIEQKQSGEHRDEPLVFPSLGRSIARARDNVAQEFGYDDEESFQDSDDPDFDDALMEMDHREEGVLTKAHTRLERAVGRVLTEGGFDNTPPVQDVMRSLDLRLPRLDEVEHTRFYQALEGAGEDLRQDDGTPGNAVFATQVVRRLGYDTIILHDADKRWPGFEMEPGTKHIQVFADAPTDRITILASHSIERPTEKLFGNRERTHQDRAAYIRARAQEMNEQYSPPEQKAMKRTSRSCEDLSL